MLAPLPVWGIVGIFGVFSDLSIQGWTVWDAIGHEMFSFPYFVIGSYFFCFVVALPLYAWGWRRSRISLLSCLFCGAIIGGGP
ncbi:MAG: hypothetical protein ACXU8O_08900, partial [Asticcacaulis sp.]